MRNLAIRIVLWLCARYEITLIDETRRDAGGNAIARAERWEAFAKEHGGLYDMIEEQRHSLFQAYANTMPSEREVKDNLAMQDRCWQQVKARVDNVIASGKLAAADKPHSVTPIRKSV